MVTKIEVSVVLPVLDEVESLGVLHRELTEALKRLGRSYEIIFVDDGSRDRTWELIEQRASQGLPVIGLRLCRNYGHQCALLAGLLLLGIGAWTLWTCSGCAPPI